MTVPEFASGPVHHCGVAELLTVAAELLSDHTGEFAVAGTVTGFRPARGWARAQLVTYQSDQRTAVAKVPVVFRPGTDLPNGLEGAEVLVQGKLAVHPVWGFRFEAVAVTVLRERSASTRLVDDLVDQVRRNELHLVNKALPLGDDAERLAVVCPLGGGAGGNDFTGRLGNSEHHWQLRSIEVNMGTPDAAEAIARAVTTASSEPVDAVVVCRGGGAASDLAVFNTETVAAAIVAAQVPVVCAVGHSTDSHVADLVAHTSLATPSAAAAWFDERRSRARHRAALAGTRRRTVAANAAAMAYQKDAARARASAAASARRERTTTTVACTAIALLSAVMVAFVVLVAGALP